MRTKSLALAAMAVTAGLLSLGSVQAASLITGSSAPPGITDMQDSNVQQVNHKKWYNNYNNKRYYNNHRRNHHNNGWGSRSGVFLGLGVAPLLYNGYGNEYGAYNGYGSGAYGGGSGHVSYCLNRYRTYNPRTDLFRGYDGYLHHCISPYQY